MKERLIEKNAKLMQIDLILYTPQIHNYSNLISVISVKMILKMHEIRT